MSNHDKNGSNSNERSAERALTSQEISQKIPWAIPIAFTEAPTEPLAHSAEIIPLFLKEQELLSHFFDLRLMRYVCFGSEWHLEFRLDAEQAKTVRRYKTRLYASLKLLHAFYIPTFFTRCWHQKNPTERWELLLLIHKLGAMHVYADKLRLVLHTSFDAQKFFQERVGEGEEKIGIHFLFRRPEN
ncbi:MAG: hypothetical protein M0R76_11460 [Proteobacteria bacterium]|nr:hypothetical protein [Pseudomonadota bacterium]